MLLGGFLSGFLENNKGLSVLLKLYLISIISYIPYAYPKHPFWVLGLIVISLANGTFFIGIKLGCTFNKKNNKTEP